MKNKDTRLILGPPGTGKTQRMITYLEEEIAFGLDPTKIAFLTFTRKAAAEAVDRIVKQFKLKRKDMPFFRTLHSLAYQQLGLSKGALMQRADYQIIGKALGVDFSSYYDMDEGLIIGNKEGDKLLALHSFAKARCMQAREAWEYAQDIDVQWLMFEQFYNTLEQYKNDNGLIDFSDMLTLYTLECAPIPIEAAFIDEAQDLSTLQWSTIQVALSNAKRMYIAGDDDQAIYKWAGADVQHFLSLKGEREVLGQSYRIPQTIHHLANRISGQITQRYEKQWEPKQEEGELHNLQSLYELKFDNKEWLLLARNAYLLDSYIQLLREQGYAYIYKSNSSIRATHRNAIKAWENLRKGEHVTVDEAMHAYEFISTGVKLKRGAKAKLKKADHSLLLNMADLQKEYGLAYEGIWHEALDRIPAADRSYYVAILRNKGSLFRAPNIIVSTIHGVKGGEADNVVLRTDLAYRSFRGLQTDPNDEHRVFYVGATRARQALYVVGQVGRWGYPMP